MTNEEIRIKLDDLLLNPKSKNFLTHLIKNYIPVDKVTKVLTTPSGVFKCVISDDELFSINDVLTGLHSEEFKNNFIEDLKNKFNDNKISNLASSIVGDKVMGVTGEKTTTYMSLPTYKLFFDWVMTKLLSGDKHINWVLGSLQKKRFGKESEFFNKELNKTLKQIKKPVASTYSLADTSDVLAKLKAKMESE